MRLSRLLPALARALALAGSMAAGCAGEPPAEGAGARPGGRADGRERVAEGRVELRGVARDAKCGAVIVTDGGGAIYVQGLDAWPAEVHGKRIVASGVVREKKLIPDPVSRDGLQSTGAWGNQDVLEDARWALDPSPAEGGK